MHAWLSDPNEPSRCLALFPEGCRSKTGKLNPLKNTAFKLALQYRKNVLLCVSLGKLSVFSHSFIMITFIVVVLVKVRVRFQIFFTI